MPNPFLEERINTAAVLQGASYADEYNVEVIRTSNDQEYRRLIHPFPVRRFRFQYMIDSDAVYTSILNLYHRAYGKFKGFRVVCVDDFSTNDQTGAPAFNDQVIQLVSSGVYQLVKTYGSTGAVRTLFKPVAGTVLLGIGATAIRSNDWTVDTTTGRITLAANKSFNVTGISKAASAVITFASHTFAIGQSISITGVVGMTQINNIRALITNVVGNNVTVAINSTAFSTWTSGGVCNTNPQAGEVVTGGCHFDIPVRFDTAIEVGQSEYALRSLNGVELVELINP